MKLNALPGFEVNVCSNGAPLQEYEDEDRLEGVRFVEATSGSNFAVTIRFEPRMIKKILENHVTAEVKLDGKFAASYIYKVAGPHAHEHQMSGVRSQMAGQEMLQRFIFGDLLTNDGPAGHIKTEDVKHLGEIQVGLLWVRDLGSRDQSGPPATVERQQSLPEKCLKGRSISHKASYGKAEPATSTRVAIVDHPYGKDPFATFTFKYRSRCMPTFPYPPSRSTDVLVGDLQIEGLIPRTSSPVPLEERDPDDLSPEEARELVRRMRASRTDGEVKVKAEKRGRDDDQGEDDDVEVTDQRSTKRSRMSTDSAVEIIDLTDD